MGSPVVTCRLCHATKTSLALVQVASPALLLHNMCECWTRGIDQVEVHVDIGQQTVGKGMDNSSSESRVYCWGHLS